MEKKTKKRLALWIPVSVLALVCAFVLFVGHGSFGFVSGKLPATEFSDIMRKASEGNADFADTSVTKIAVLGSHDALSYNINYSSPPNTSEDNVVNKAWIRVIGKGALVRYSRAQRHDIYTQLKYGVRYIDVRITNIDGIYYNSHGLVSHKLEDSLNGILKFLDENPGEYIIFHIVHYYPGESDFDSLCEFMSSVKYKEKSLFDHVNYDTSAVKSQQELTYNKMTDGGTKAGALLIYDGAASGDCAEYFALSDIDSRWHNITNSDKLKNAVRAHFETLPSDPSCLTVNQAQTTPKGDDVWGVFTGWSLIDMAAKHNLNMLADENFDKWLDKMPVYMCDFATSSYGDFNTKVNNAILSHNLALTLSV